MVDKVTLGKSLPEAVQQQIIEKTDGVPLFVEELTKTILESGLLTEESDRYALSGKLSGLAIPATLQDSLMARLDRLAKGKPVAQAGAVIGREFNRKLLEPTCGLQPLELNEALDELVDSGLVFRHGNGLSVSFVFKHALVQEAAYESLLRSKRRNLHEHIAEALLHLFPETAEAQPELLAHHYTEANCNETAIKFWLQAGQRAAENSASEEAVAHLSKGLEVLRNLPESSARARQELDFQLALCSPIMIIKGWGAEETAATYARARELCTLLGETMQLQSVLNGEYMRELTLANFQAARNKGVELLRLGEQQNDVEAILQGHRIVGWGSLYLGELTASMRHINEALRLYQPEQHEGLKFRYAHDPRVATLSVRAILQTLCGYPEQATKTTAEALNYARAINHMSSLAYGLMFAGALPATLRHDSQKASEYAEEILLLSEKLHSDLWLGFGRVIAGWSASVQVTNEDGVQLLSQGLKDLEPASPNPCWPLFLALLAEAYFTGGETRQAISSLTEALQLVERTDERVWEARIRIFYGKVLLSQHLNNTQEAERMFVQALDAATEQGAKFLELRAAIGLAGIWQKQSRQDKAQKILAPIYEWFTEGFDTPDLIEAQELLDKLK